MRMRWKLLGAVALIGILSIPVCWITPKGPKVDAEGIRAAAASYDARIIRDQWGVPHIFCLLYTSPSPRDKRQSRMPSSA